MAASGIYRVVIISSTGAEVDTLYVYLAAGDSSTVRHAEYSRILARLSALADWSTFDAGSDGVTVTTNNDKTGYSLTAAYDNAKTAAQAGDAMALTDSAITAAKLAADAVNAIAAGVEAAILDEGDATALLAAISAKVEEFLVNDGDSTATLAAIGAAVRTALATELARIDVATSTRLATAGYTAPDNSGIGTASTAATSAATAAAAAQAAAEAAQAAAEGITPSDATLAKQNAILTAIGAIDTQAGPGSRRLDFTVEVGGTARSGVEVWISTDSPYTTGGTVAGTLTTDDSGLATFYVDEDVTYYLWRDSSNYNFTDPIQFRYSSANARWEKWDGSAWTAWS